MGTFGITYIYIIYIYIIYNNIIIYVYIVCIHLATRNIMGRLQTTPSGKKSGGPLGTLGKIIEVNGRFCSMPCSISAGQVNYAHWELFFFGELSNCITNKQGFQPQKMSPVSFVCWCMTIRHLACSKIKKLTQLAPCSRDSRCRFSFLIVQRNRQIRTD